MLLSVILFHLFMANNPACVCVRAHVRACMHICHIFIYSSVSGYFGCFHILAIVYSVAMNIQVHVYFQIMVLSRYIPRSGIARSYGNSIFSF